MMAGVGHWSKRSSLSYTTGRAASCAHGRWKDQQTSSILNKYYTLKCAVWFNANPRIQSATVCAENRVFYSDVIAKRKECQPK